MKRLLLVLVALFVGVGIAMAATNGQITVQCSPSLGVAVSTANAGVGDAADPTAIFALGPVATNASCIIPTPFYIWNTSPSGAASVETISLQGGNATGGSGWTLSGTTSGGVDAYGLAGLFTASAPGSFVAADSVTSTAKQWNGTNFYNAGYNGGVFTCAGPLSASSNRSLYIGLYTPTATGSNTAKTISLTVTAGYAGS